VHTHSQIQRANQQLCNVPANFITKNDKAQKKKQVLQLGLCKSHIPSQCPNLPFIKVRKIEATALYFLEEY